MIFKVTKVKSIRHADILAKHLLRADENEAVKVLDIRGTARPADLAASLRSMQRATVLTNGKTGLFHISINPRKDEAVGMTGEQWERTQQAIEDEYKLHGQPRVIVEHRKEGRIHRHVVYQLTLTDMGKLIDIKNERYRCKALARRLELEFSQAITSNGVSRDSYSRPEHQQAKRKGQCVSDRRRLLRRDYANSQDIEAFNEKLAARGYVIAVGDRAALVLVDAAGDVYGLTRELGIKLKEFERFIGEQLQALPQVKELKAKRKSIVPVQPIKDNRKELMRDFMQNDWQDSADLSANDNKKQYQRNLRPC